MLAAMSIPFFAPAPSAVADLSDACCRFVEKAVGMAPDFSPETLPVVDHYARTLPPDASREVLSLIVPATGAYFGEVVRRSYPGVHWHCPDEDYAAYRLQFERVYLTFNPLGVALEVLTRKDAGDWHAHFDVQARDRPTVEESLQAVRGVREDDYYRFAVRYEAIDQIVHLLQALQEQRGEAPHALTAEDYAR